jgi:membrane protein
MPIKGIGTRIARLWRRDIWQSTLRTDRSPRGWFYALLRAISILGTTYTQTKAASRAADLSFSSMLGLGPLIAISVLVASTVFGERNPNLGVNMLDRLITFVAPQLTQYDSVNSSGAVPVNPELVALINGFIKGAQSSTAGVVGGLLLVVIVLFLFKSIEDVFNEIWGVRRGRTLLLRIAFYWSILTLGGLLFFASVELIGTQALVNVLVERLPYGAEAIRLMRGSLPTLSFVLLVGVLAVFYRTIPNTRVKWRAALAGAFIVALLLMANNFLQFLYLKRVLITKSLFGSLGIIPVLMFGLFIFWLIVLIGGQISYAVQNVDVRYSKLAWGSLSANNRERLSLAVLLAVCRRFHAGLPPISDLELSDAVRLPTQVLNECLNRIVDLGFVIRVPKAPGAARPDEAYQPARALSRITLFEFKSAADNFGADPAGDALERIDPIVREFGVAAERIGDEAFFRKTVEELLSEESAAK